MPKRSRRYPTKKNTSTRQGKKDYMRQYMRDYRKSEREMLKAAKKIFEWPPKLKRGG